ncbi:IS5 family transposase, partial [Nitrosomonas sp. Nm84]|uniref:IS5 family transposase n=1 Tax=Nitrosomonas sp. Nm84 TaxID=200124 RepID=UPI000D767627
IDALIEWEKLRPQLTNLYKRELSHGGGQEPFDALMMFKAILLGQWHSLSDAALEQALCVRIDFLQFCGLSLSDAIPDETTLCRFRNRLITDDRLDGLLASINEQLQSHGLMVKGATGAVIDATLIESAARPKRTIVLEVDAEGKVVQFEDGSQPGITCTEEQSADLDAAWLKKGKKSQFGYRSYLVVDEQDGYVHGVHTAPANQSEMLHFEAAIDGAHIEADRVYADKGSASQANRQFLKQHKIKSAIMHRAYKNRPLSARQKLANRLISKKRYIVEQCFGTIKRLFRMRRASYFGTVKVNAQVMLKSICMNLKKAANKIFVDQPVRREIRPNIA